MLLEGVTNINQVECYKGCELAIDQETLPPLEEGNIILPAERPEGSGSAGA
ncbi:MAG: hypothetical protein ACLSA6_08025 [Holdemania massiliensis]